MKHSRTKLINIIIHFLPIGESKMASEYTHNFNLDLYTDTDKPNLRDQYKAAMEKIDSALQKKTNDITATEVLIENEVTARKNADTKLTNDLADETEVRTAADTKITNDLAAETEARTAADTKLTNDLAAETEARTAADTYINQEIELLKNLDDIVIEDIKDSDFGTKWSLYENTPGGGHFKREDVKFNAVAIYHKKDKFGIICGTVYFNIQSGFTFTANSEFGIAKVPNYGFIESEPYHYSTNAFTVNNNVIKFAPKNSEKAGVISILNWTGQDEQIQAGWSRCSFSVPFNLYE